MNRFDRRYLLVVVMAWLVVYVALLSRDSFSLDELLQYPIPFIVIGLVLVAFAAAIIAVMIVAIPLRIILNVAMKDRRRLYFWETILLALGFVLVFAYFFEVGRERRQLVPPKEVKTLRAFASAMSPPERLELVQKDGREYILWTGECTGPFDIPSGPSCYLFDDHGGLIDYQVVTGDGGRVEDFLKSAAKGRVVTLDEAMEMTREDNK